MCKCEEYAGILRVGEKARDASDKIRGFLYQDMLAIELILKATENEKIYVEWVEDIFVEDAQTISIYQVKHCPESKPAFKEIYENMFYQFLKFKLYENNKKDIKTFFLCHTNEYKEICGKDIASHIKKENDILKINKLDIIRKLEVCDNMVKRKDLIFSEVASLDILKDFKYETVKKNNVSITSEELKEALYKEFNTIYNLDENIFQIQSRKDMIDILLAVAIQYIQQFYYNKPEDADFRDRCITKKSFISYMEKVVGNDDEKNTTRIKFLVLSYIDKLFTDIQYDMVDNDIATNYKELYFSTKEFFVEKLETKEQRFKFLNTVSTNEYEEFNLIKYMDCTANEMQYYMENKDKIIQFIIIVWKFLFNNNSKIFGEFIRESDQCFFIELPDENAKPAIIVSAANGTSNRDARKTLSRIVNSIEKPRKWYFKGDLRGIYQYQFNVNKIKKVELDGEFSVLCNDQDCFRIECLNCINYDDNGVEKKDLNIKCLFGFECINGGVI